MLRLSKNACPDAPLPDIWREQKETAFTSLIDSAFVISITACTSPVLSRNYGLRLEPRHPLPKCLPDLRLEAARQLDRTPLFPPCEHHCQASTARALLVVHPRQDHSRDHTHVRLLHEMPEMATPEGEVTAAARAAAEARVVGTEDHIESAATLVAQAERVGECRAPRLLWKSSPRM